MIHYLKKNTIQYKAALLWALISGRLSDLEKHFILAPLYCFLTGLQAKLSISLTHTKSVAILLISRYRKCVHTVLTE